jgi:hypothetical protein
VIDVVGCAAVFDQRIRTVRYQATSVRPHAAADRCQAMAAGELDDLLPANR